LSSEASHLVEIVVFDSAEQAHRRRLLASSADGLQVEFELAPGTEPVLSRARFERINHRWRGDLYL
tara:strand:- start:74 stop:271 length:198 start_codon:yes stop_codon:yes gene_type:complete